MAVHKPKELRKIPLKTINKDVLKKVIEETFLLPAHQVKEMMKGEGSHGEISIVEMAIIRCAYLSYFEGDTKRLEWLLNKMGIRDEVDEKSVDLSSLNSTTILKALNVKPIGKSDGKKRPKKN